MAPQRTLVDRAKVAEVLIRSLNTMHVVGAEIVSPLCQLA
jgi:hypothetical protein